MNALNAVEVTVVEDALNEAGFVKRGGYWTHKVKFGGVQVSEGCSVSISTGNGGFEVTVANLLTWARGPLGTPCVRG